LRDNRHHGRRPLPDAASDHAAAGGGCPLSLTPLGRDIVDLEQARRLVYAPQVAVPTERVQRAD